MTELMVQTLVSGLLWGFIFALIAVGLTIIYGMMDIINFAHGEYLMVGMYVAYWLNVGLGMDPLVAIPFSAAVLWILGVLTYKILIRRVLDASLLAQIFVTFGLMIFLRYLAQLLFSADFRSVQDPILSGNFMISSVSISTAHLVSAVVAMLMTAAVYWFIMKTETGWALQAVAENKQAAQLMGINSDRVYSIAWGLGGACVGVAGALLASFFYIFPEVGDTFGLIAFITVALGGFGSIPGVFVAGVLIGVVQVLGGLVFDPAYKYALVFGLYMIVVVVRPKGLMGSA